MPLIPTPVRLRFEALLEPIARGFISLRVYPNTLTTVGALVLVVSGVSYGGGWVRWGGVLLLLSGVFDILDGMVARLGARTTRFGAFYDSTLDRVGEVAPYTGIAVYCLQGGVSPDRAVTAVVICMIGLGSAMIVPYARARAEGLGLDGRVGLAQRADRIVLLGIPSVLFGAGPEGWLLLAIVVVLAVMSIVTVLHRIMYVHRQTRGDAPAPLPDPAGKGKSARQKTADARR